MQTFKIFSICLVALVAFVGAETDCQKHKAREAKNNSPLKLDVQCTDSGDYKALQCFPGNKFCYCALPDGTQITQPSRLKKFCSCELSKYDVQKTLNVNGRPIEPSTGTWVPDCQRDGLFKNKQCEAGTGVCWCIDQDGKQVSKDRSKDIKCE